MGGNGKAIGIEGGSAGLPIFPSEFPSSVGGRRRTLGLAGCGLSILLFVIVAALTSRAEDWQPVSLLVVVTVFTIASEVLHIRRRRAPTEIEWVFTATAPLIAGMVLLGPAPTLLIAALGLAISDSLRRCPAEARLSNLANYATFIVTGGLLFRWLTESLAVGPEETAFAALAMALYLYVAVLSWLHNAITGKVFWRDPIRRQLREEGVFVPVDLICAPLTAITVYAYANLGLAALGTLALVQIAHQWLLGNLIMSRKRAEILEQQTARLKEVSTSRGRLVGQVLQAEETERRRLAESLHDEALQNLLTALRALGESTGGPADGDVEHARTGIQRTIDQLRGAIFNLHPDVLQHAGLGPALRAVAREEADRAGFQAEVDVEEEASGDHDGLLFVLAREQLSNAARHSGATRVAVLVRRQEEAVVMEVKDNGRGMRPLDRSVALRQGHIGLASSAERLEAIGGELRIESEPGSGTLIRTTLPLNGNGLVQDAAPHRLGDRG